MKNLYTVTFLHSQTGNEEVSRYFQTIRAARRWAKWLETTSFVTYARVFRGQAGGELVYGPAR